MKHVTTTPTGARLGPLLFDCCRCGPGRAIACLRCRRWLAHSRNVTACHRKFAKIGGR